MITVKAGTFAAITVKTTVVHTVTYFVVGLLAFTLLDYNSKFADPIVSKFMRQTNDPLVAAGPSLQIIRGFLFGLVFFAFRECIFERKNGWLILWSMLVIVGILSPFGAAPSSIEGIIYTYLPAWFHILGLPEVLVQSFLLAFVTNYWVNNPSRKWLGWMLWTIFVLVILMSIMGVLAGSGVLQRT